MTRPKVPEDKRQRTAQACDTCKRRKQKCNGLRPCNTCTKKSLTCSYTTGTNSPDHNHADPSASPTKRRHVEDTSTVSDSAPPPPSPLGAPAAQWDRKPRQDSNTARPTVEFDVKQPDDQEQDPVAQVDHDFENRSRHSTISGPDEETSLLQSTRMLQDPTGRLLYVGDSATLSYLQLIRMIVEARTGPNRFTLDPSRHKIMENTITMPPNVRPPHILPDKVTADILVESFFTNTQGLCQIFSRRAFEKAFEATYNDPLAVDSSFLCLLYLTFAIGMVFATPMQGSREEAVLRKLRTDHFDRAELFFRSAKALGDPVSGFEDADFWSVQALSLMAIYMLAVSKRNAAYAYFGMAVRSAFALGLHRVSETHFIFKSDEVKLRRNLWRSLFVLDRFLAASLGRPAAIAEDECSDDALMVFEKNAYGDLIPAPDPTGGLDAAVRSCQVIGQILKKIYARRKISIRLSQEIADQCRAWSSSLHPELHWRRVLTTPSNAASGLAALHVNLLYCHSIILLTRPFFICLLSKVHNERSGHTLPVPRWINRMAKYCEACLNASNHTIALVQMAHESRYLPQRNPFVLYFLFAASLVVLSNEFASIYPNPSYNASIENTMAIMHYCSETDPQAARLLYILTSFRSAVADVNQQSKNPPAMPALATLSPTALHDPMAGLFMPGFGSASRRNSVAGTANTTPTVPKAPMAPPPLSVKPESTFPGNGVSPASSTTGLSHSIGDASGRVMNEPETTESLGGEAELDFDSLWTWSSAPQAVSHEGPANGPPAHPYAQDGVPGPRYDTYPGFTGPTIPHANGSGSGNNGNTNGTGSGYGMAASVPMFAASEFP